MRFQNEFKSLSSELGKLLKRDQHHMKDESKFITLKNEILAILKTLFGETSREYRVVKLTNSPATVAKVMNHIVNRTENLTSARVAANM